MRLFRLLLFAASLGLAGLVKRFYRPWVYQQGISDFGVADFAPSLLYGFGMAILAAAATGISARLRPVKNAAMVGVGVGASLYEISQVFRKDRWFDWTDLLATMLGVSAALIVEWVLAKIERKPDAEAMDRHA